MHAVQVDELFMLAVKHVPQLLLVAMVIFIFTLFVKDIMNGFKKPFLKPDQWLPLPLVDKKILTHNTRRFRFALPHSNQKLGLPLGMHVSLKLSDAKGTEVMRYAVFLSSAVCKWHIGVLLRSMTHILPMYRSYTPSSDIDQRGYVDFVIKVRIFQLPG